MINIFIIDDSPKKVEYITSLINDSFSKNSVEVYLAQNTSDAMKVLLEKSDIHLLILDLNLPVREGGKIRTKSGLRLLKEISRREDISKPNSIIGLTSYNSIKIEVQEIFQKEGWVIEKFSLKEPLWEELIINKISYLMSERISLEGKKEVLEPEIETSTTIKPTNEKDFALIMKGGGIKGLAHVGAIEILQRFYSFNWYGGTSAGAIAALLLSAGYTNTELNDILGEKNFNDFKDARFPKNIINLITKGGLYKGLSFQIWLEQLLAKKLNKATAVKLQDLPSRCTIYATRRGKSALIFDSKDPETKGKEAGYTGRCSMSIPFIFTPQKHEGLNVYDGGSQNNYPVEVFKNKNPDIDFIGLYLGPKTFEGNKQKNIFKDYFSIYQESSDIEALNNYSDSTVIIDPRPIKTLQFKLSSEEKEFLLESGRVSAIEYLIKQNKITKEDELSKNLDSRKQKLAELKSKIEIKSVKSIRWKKFLLLLLISSLALIGIFSFNKNILTKHHYINRSKNNLILDKLWQDVDSIFLPPNKVVASPLKTISNNSIPIIAKTNNNTIISTYSQFGKGQAYTFGTEGIFFDQFIIEGQNMQFILNCLGESKSLKKEIIIPTNYSFFASTNRIKKLKSSLYKIGFEITETSTSFSEMELNSDQILFFGNTWDRVSNKDIQAIQNFVKEGGTLISGGTLWSYLINKKGNADNYSLNKILAPMGVKFINGQIDGANIQKKY